MNKSKSICNPKNNHKKDASIIFRSSFSSKLCPDRSYKNLERNNNQSNQNLREFSTVNLDSSSPIKG